MFSYMSYYIFSMSVLIVSMIRCLNQGSFFCFLERSLLQNHTCLCIASHLYIGIDSLELIPSFVIAEISCRQLQE